MYVISVFLKNFDSDTFFYEIFNYSFFINTQVKGVVLDQRKNVLRIKKNNDVDNNDNDDCTIIMKYHRIIMWNIENQVLRYFFFF